MGPHTSALLQYVIQCLAFLHIEVQQQIIQCFCANHPISHRILFICAFCCCAAGTQRDPPVDPLRRTHTVEERAPAHLKRRAGDVSPRPIGARDADATQIWMSLSMRRNTPREGILAMNLMQRSWRGETKASTYTVRVHRECSWIISWLATCKHRTPNPSAS